MKRTNHKKRHFGKYKIKHVANLRKPFPKYRYIKRRNAPVKYGCCFICKKKGHFAAKCPKNTSSKLKKCMEMDEFVDNWSVVDSEDECFDVYILSETEDTVAEEGIDTSQKTNICIASNCETESESETITEYSQT